MSRRLPLFLLAFLAVTPAFAQGAAPAPAALLDSAATIAAGRKYTEWFYGDMGDSLVAHSSEAVKEKITAAQLSDFSAQLASQVGGELEVLSERAIENDSLSAYLREARFELMEEPLVLAFTLSAGGQIEGFFIRPKSQMPADEPN